MSLAGARLLAGRCPVWRWRESGLRLSCGTWEGVSWYRPRFSAVAAGRVPPKGGAPWVPSRDTLADRLV